MGLINYFKGLSNEHNIINANGKIKDILPDADFSNLLILQAGNKITADYEVKENDVIYCRLLPGVVSSTTLAVIGITTAVVAAGAAIGSLIYSGSANEKTKQEQENAQKMANDLAASITSLPFLKGSKNQSALGRNIPYIMGSVYHTPYILNKGYFYSISGEDGCDQFLNGVLLSGYNDQKVEKVLIGTEELLTLPENEVTQDKVYNITNSNYQNAANDAKIEINTSGNLLLEGLNQKVTGEVYGTEIKHNYGEAAEEVIKQLEPNAQKVEVCLRYDGLRQYDTTDLVYKSRAVKVVPYWSNNGGSSWHKFYFEINSTSSTTYEWNIATADEIAAAVTAGNLKKETFAIKAYSSITTFNYVSNSADWKVKLVSRTVNGAGTAVTDVWEIRHRTKVTTADGDNTVRRNTNKTIRFVATKSFTAAESYGKDILIKLVRETPRLEKNGTETAILEYINTFCFDAKKSTSSKLEPCKALEAPFNSQVTKIGVKLIANEHAADYIDELHIMTSGKARTWNGSAWTSARTVTRNPAAWVLEILTSDKHPQSKINDNEIDLESFGALYEYCNTNNLYTDGIITASGKKSDIITDILSGCFSDLIINTSGKYEVITDKPEAAPVALLNSESIKSITYSKTFEREITGKKVTYTDRNTWALNTDYVMKDGGSYNQQEDSVTELNLNYVTTKAHAYKIAQRQLRKATLQPREIKADVGLEGDYYPLHSTVLLQIDKLKIGLKSSTVRAITTDADSGAVTAVTLSDTVQMESGKRYGVVIQAQNNSGRKLLYKEVTNSGEGIYNRLVFAVPVSASDSSYLSNGNTVTYGELNNDGSFTRVTNTMKIEGIEPGSDNGYSLVLRDYNAAIYDVGTIPEYKSNYTSPAPKLQTIPKEYATVQQVQDSAVETAAQVTENVTPIIENIVETVAPAIVPRYRGKVEALPEDTTEYNNGDWVFLTVATDTEEIGLYKLTKSDDGDEWAEIEYNDDGSNDSYFNAATGDLLPYYTAENAEQVAGFARAYINHLFVNKITIGENGSIQSANYSEENGTGFMLDSETGDIKANNGYFRGNISTIEVLGEYSDLKQSIEIILFERNEENKNIEWDKKITILLKGIETISAGDTIYKSIFYRLCDVNISSISYTGGKTPNIYLKYTFTVNGLCEDWVKLKIESYSGGDGKLFDRIKLIFTIPYTDIGSYSYNGKLYILTENLNS